jgi:pilus assembly protein TadC
MIIYIGNNWQYLFINNEVAQASKIVRISKDSAIKNNALIKNFVAKIKNTDISKLSQHEKIKLLKEQIRAIKHDKDTSKSNKTLLIVLSVVLALVLLFCLAILSCSISCSGSEALAVIVAIAGTFLIIFFLVRFIKHLSNRPEKKKEVIKNDENKSIEK